MFGKNSFKLTKKAQSAEKKIAREILSPSLRILAFFSFGS
jgi:hypothetical protein